MGMYIHTAAIMNKLFQYSNSIYFNTNSGEERALLVPYLLWLTRKLLRKNAIINKQFHYFSIFILKTGGGDNTFNISV
jgi:hypothetical protein